MFFLDLAAACDFEYDRCGWKEASDDSDQFDWQRRKGSTPSIGTGPTIDHTTNSTSGYYLYIEATSGTAYQNAKLISPLYRKVSRTTTATITIFTNVIIINVTVMLFIITPLLSSLASLASSLL